MSENATTAPDGATLAQRVQEYDWYHTIDLPGGITTPGYFDTRKNVAKVPLPASLEGKRCLDVGTWDGFWAFEMEKRGAASVTAIDIDDAAEWDWPPHTDLDVDPGARLAFLADFKAGARGFHLAHEALGSKVERVNCSIYDLSPERLGGTFDFVFLGSLLLHLRDPVRALAAMRTVVGGEAVIAESVELIPSIVRRRTPTARLDGINVSWWWQPNVAAFHQMVRSAGFEILEHTGIYILPTGERHPKTPLSKLPRKLRTAKGREEIVIALKGLPHAAVRVRPAR